MCCLPSTLFLLFTSLYLSLHYTRCQCVSHLLRVIAKAINVSRGGDGIGGGGEIEMEQLMGSTATETPVQPCGQQQTGKLISICTTAKWPSGYCCCCCCCLPSLSSLLTLSCLPLASLLLPQRVVHFANEQQALPCCHRYRLLPSACCLLPSACLANLLPCCLLPPPYELILCHWTVG